jgi:hypothetical protein
MQQRESQRTKLIPAYRLAPLLSLAHFGPDLFKQYQARPDNDKFTLVCIVHNAFEMDWALEHGKDWVREGALRVLPISAQFVPFLPLPLDTCSGQADATCGGIGCVLQCETSFPLPVRHLVRHATSSSSRLRIHTRALPHPCSPSPARPKTDQTRYAHRCRHPRKLRSEQARLRERL